MGRMKNSWISATSDYYFAASVVPPLESHEDQIFTSTKQQKKKKKKKKKCPLLAGFRNLMDCGASDNNNKRRGEVKMKKMIQQRKKRRADGFIVHIKCFSTASTQIIISQSENPKFTFCKRSDKRTGELFNDKTQMMKLPICSQCGKAFDPHKLVTHIQFCSSYKLLK
ncbi:uncharacterized protein LOC127260596 [Andrographis paniculata]|uniref:uncharacterized protein LOC127260596 n=1 Tax=Andrographis paniculata TaxID=175694 RepID=UPI0021E7848E|nr:uncharacterized protein LOC127260596 [Andrographis paniculata]